MKHPHQAGLVFRFYLSARNASFLSLLFIAVLLCSLVHARPGAGNKHRANAAYAKHDTIIRLTDDRVGIGHLSGGIFRLDNIDTALFKVTLEKKGYQMSKFVLAGTFGHYVLIMQGVAKDGSTIIMAL